jgi:hypothetical protein
MKHKSIPVQGQVCEFINVQPMNPLISKCQIKVCYVSDKPNRNRSIITKDVAREMANSLPGSPIVGYYNEVSKDFEEHNRTIKLSNGNFEIEDATRPYGFVDMNAKCWFQKFYDDDSVEREYLVTEGYIWTGQYPEAQRIIDKGNNQSMELDENTLDATWAKDENGKPKFFIINEAVISKLCILGEECEPCFEGSNITPVQFSFSDGFQNEMLSMMKELKEFLLSEGGTQVFTRYAVEIGDALWSALYSYIEKTYPDGENGWCSVYRIEGVFEEGGQKFAVLQNRTDMKYFKLVFSLSETEGFTTIGELEEVTKTYKPASEPQFSLEEVEAFETEYKKNKEDEEKGKDDKSDKPENEDKSEGENPDDKKDAPKDDEKPADGKKDGEKSDEEGKDDEEDKKKKKYSLEEIPEYVELASKFSELETKYNALVSENEQLKAEVEPLKQFKADSDKKEKQAMIDSFCMLSDEDKKDVIDNIDTYSLDDIEAKLSIICVRNKVSFNLDDDNKDNAPHVYNLGGDALLDDSSTPAWVKAALDVAKTLN